MIHRRALGLSLHLMWVLALAGLGQQAAPDDPAGLEKRVNQIRRLMGNGRWKPALHRLQQTLKEHANQTCARLRTAELIELHKRCSFRASVGKVDPNSVISGELLAWNPATGKIKIRYTRSTMADFERDKTTFTHGMRMAGPYVVSVRGKRYPSILGSDGAPTIYVCSDSKRGLWFSFGFEQAADGGTDKWMPARVVDVSKKGQDAIVAEKEITLAKSGKPFLLKVKVGKTSARSSFNNRSLLKAAKEKDHFGYFGVDDLGSLNELIIEGIAEPAWLQGRIDASLEKARTAFEKRYDPRKHLPEWLFEAGAKGAKGTRGATAKREADAEYPGTFTKRQRYFLGRVERLIEKKKYRKAIEFLEKQNDERIPQPTRSFLLGSCLMAREKYEKALPHARRVSKDAPAFFAGQIVLAECLAGVGQRAAALELYERLGAKHPHHVVLHVSLARLLMVEGRFAGAKKAIVAAMSQATPAQRKVIVPLHRSIAKAVDGPDWSRVFESKSKHYHVYSDIDRKTCVEAAKILEAAHRCYNVHLKTAKRTGKRFRVYLFSGEASYLAYCEDLFGEAPRHTAGLYADHLKQLLIWNLPNRDAMMRTVRHEGFHQYLSRVLPSAPRWLDEGHAEYYETAEYANGRWRTGKVRDDHVEALRSTKNRPLPLADFLYVTPSKFYKNATRNYAQAWAFIHFLRHGPQDHRKIIDTLFARLQANEPVRKTLRSVFSPAALPSLEKQFLAYVQQMAGAK